MMMSIVNQSVNMKKIARNRVENEQLRCATSNTNNKEGRFLAENIRICSHMTHTVLMPVVFMKKLTFDVIQNIIRLNILFYILQQWPLKWSHNEIIHWEQFQRVKSQVNTAHLHFMKLIHWRTLFERCFHFVMPFVVHILKNPSLQNASGLQHNVPFNISLLHLRQAILVSQNSWGKKPFSGSEWMLFYIQTSCPHIRFTMFADSSFFPSIYFAFAAFFQHFLRVV